MKTILVSALLALYVLSSTPSHAADVSLTAGLAEVRIVDPLGKAIRASILIVKTPPDYVYRHSFSWGGDETEPPRTVIAKLEVVRGRQNLSPPVSAYADLGDPHRMSLEFLPKGGVKLTIIGGDAAGGYTASMEFSQSEIYRRRVISGEFPDAWEETRYSFNHFSD